MRRLSSLSCLLRRNRLLPLLLSLLLLSTLILIFGSNLGVNRDALGVGNDEDEDNFEDMEDRHVDMSQKEKTDESDKSSSRFWVPPRRVVHLDLKGGAPKLSYFKSLFPLIRASGGTHLLIEYEDMFPYSGILANLSSSNAYTKRQIRSLLKLAKSNELRVIPLVQTFGHLEFALKLQEFQTLREVDYYPQSLCPSNENALELVYSMVEQMAEMHPDSTWLHIGCDEVTQLGLCPKCSERILSSQNKNFDGDDQSYVYGDKLLFLQHVRNVGEHVRNLGFVPIIWDDMLRSLPPNMFKILAGKVEPMIWVYVEDIDRFVDPNQFALLAENFKFLWTASAFKGAFGETLYSVNVKRHVENSKAWLQVMRRERQKGNVLFRGIVLTGWSRYDHFAILCELLPVAIPSLVLNTLILSKGRHSDKIATRARQLLRCENNFEEDNEKMLSAKSLMSDENQWDLRLNCHFEGAQILSAMYNYDQNRREIDELHRKVISENGWMSEYNFQHKFSSPQRVMEVLRQINFVPDEILGIRQNMESALAKVFDKHTIDEWLEQHVQPLERMLEEVQRRGAALISVRTWPRRPLIDNQMRDGKEDDDKKESREKKKRWPT